MKETWFCAVRDAPWRGVSDAARIVGSESEDCAPRSRRASRGDSRATGAATRRSTNAHSVSPRRGHGRRTRLPSSHVPVPAGRAPAAPHAPACGPEVSVPVLEFAVDA